MPAKRKSGSVRAGGVPTRVPPRPTGNVCRHASTPLAEPVQPQQSPEPVQPQYSPEPPPNQLQRERQASDQRSEPSTRKRLLDDEEEEEDLQSAVDARMGRLRRSASPERKRAKKYV